MSVEAKLSLEAENAPKAKSLTDSVGPLHRVRKRLKSVNPLPPYAEPPPGKEDSHRMIRELQARQLELEREIKSMSAQLQQSQRMESIGLLAAGTAHDLNNILMVITGYGSLSLMEVEEGVALRENLHKILAAADKGAGLTRNLLAFNRKHHTSARPVELLEVISGMMVFLDGLVGGRIKLEMGLCEENLVVNANPAQIDQVLMNLATNAKHAMPGGGTLSIGGKAVDIDDGCKRGRYAVITVADTGVGMDEATMKRIFEPFFTTKSVGEGTGLGLAIVYDVVKRHEGFVEVDSTPGKGTTFKVYLPRC